MTECTLAAAFPIPEMCYQHLERTALRGSRLKFKARLAAYVNSFSFIGLAFATFCFAASVTPSLLPRNFIVQGLLSGLALAAGYGVGVALVTLHHFLEFRDPSESVQKISKWITTVVAVAVLVACLRQMTFWQNSIRELMEMPTLETAYPFRTAGIAVGCAALLVAAMRLVIACCAGLARQLNRFVPRRVSLMISIVVVCLLLLFIGNGIIARCLVSAGDEFFLHTDGLIDDGVEQPTRGLASGSSESLVGWETIGRRGKNFIVHGPNRDEISEFLDRDVVEPIRVYVGMRSRETKRERAELALEELKRAGGFDRSLLIIATPTGTGWLDPGAVDTIEYLHGGDTAIVSMQYSYLPSWLTIIVDPQRSIESADVLFEVIFDFWKSLPKNDRPKLYLFGLSLGSLGGEVSADLYKIIEDPIQGALWSGPPFPSTQWSEITAARNTDSPQWLPTFKDGRMVRFTNQFSSLDSDQPWGPIRNVYLQYASDPMVFFSPNIAFQEPNWISGERGRDVSSHLRWYPVVTFLQIGFDLPMATSVPIGFGHNYAPADYIDAWIAVTDPPNWSDEATARLKVLFEAKD